MEWTDDGIVLGARRHGEANAVVELMTRSHGRHLGLVRGGFGLRHRPVLQAGNLVSAIWRARLDEHSAITRSRASNCARPPISAAHALYGVHHLAALCRLLPERDPNAEVFEQLALAVAVLALPARVPAPIAMASSFGILSSPTAEFASDLSPSGTCRDGGAGGPDNVKPSGSDGRRVSGADGFAGALEPMDPPDPPAQRMAATRIARFELRLLAELRLRSRSRVVCGYRRDRRSCLCVAAERSSGVPKRRRTMAGQASASSGLSARPCS